VAALRDVNQRVLREPAGQRDHSGTERIIEPRCHPDRRPVEGTDVGVMTSFAAKSAAST
jgi:hypothetical protein